VEKYGTARQVTDDNTAHALSVLDNGHSIQHAVILRVLTDLTNFRGQIAMYSLLVGMD